MKNNNVKNKRNNKKAPKLLKLDAAELARVHGGRPPSTGGGTKG